MRFERLDLNLLVALDALLTEKSVSAAAERLHLSQSATSSALGRLRDYFGDELLVLKGRNMVITARGEELVAPVREVLTKIQTTIAVSPEFDPESSDRTISIMASDYITQVLLADALTIFEREAPNMRFELLALNDNILEIFERGQTDLLISIDYSIAKNHPKKTLFKDNFVVLGWKKNTHLREPLDMEKYISLGHVVTKFGRTRLPSFEDWYLRKSQFERRVDISVPGFALIPPLLVGSNRIATVHRQLAEIMTRKYPLKAMDAPLSIPAVSLSVQWHESATNDKAIKWVVDKFCEVARTKSVDSPTAKDPHSEIFKQYSQYVSKSGSH